MRGRSRLWVVAIIALASWGCSPPADGDQDKNPREANEEVAPAPGKNDGGQSDGGQNGTTAKGQGKTTSGGSDGKKSKQKEEPGELMPPTGGEKPAAGSTSQDKQDTTQDDETGPLLIPANKTGGPAEPASKRPRAGQEVKLIPRQVLFGNPKKAAARLSSDGKRLAYLAPVDDVLNVWVGTPADPAAAQPVTKDKDQGIRSYFWAYTNRHIIYTQDKDGDENDHVYAVDVETLETTDLTPLENIRARISGVSERFPEEILVGINNRVPQLHDTYRINILSAERELVQENPGVAAFVTDDDYQVRFAVTYTPDAHQVLLKPDGEGGWEDYIKIPPGDALTSGPVGFDKTGEHLYFIDSRDRNTAALTSINLETDEQTLIASDPRTDVGGVLAHPTEKTIQAVSFTYARREWKILDEAIGKDIDYLNSVEDGEFQVTGRTLDDKHWTVAYIIDDGPVKFFHYDREQGKAKYLFSSRDDFDQYQLAKMHTAIIKSRDELNLVSYLTLPVDSDSDGDGRPDEPLPLVLDVHGGPWARDSWGFNSTHQWLANRGYAVLSVNYRGSTGFGKAFINAANTEWAGAMHDDLLDAVKWAVSERIAQEDKVAIMGGSYGGYATLVGLTFTPEVFACGVDIVGPSSLVTLLNNVPPYWAPLMPMMKQRVGDHTTEEGRQELLARSPLTKVEMIQRPLLIGQGANDPRVTQVEADQIVQAMQQRDIPVTYVLYPDEGHGFGRPENRLSFNAVVEAFLAEHLGGRFEPVGDDFEDASITVPAGAAQVPGLKEALAQLSQEEEVSGAGTGPEDAKGQP